MTPSQDAITRLEQALAEDPHRTDVFVALGMAYAEAGQPDKAVAMLSLALRRTEPDVRLLCALGRACADLHRYAESAQHYEQAHGLDPRDVDARVGLGWVWRELGRVDASAKMLRRAARLKAGRDDPRVHHQLGLTYQKARDYGRAGTSLAQAIALGADDVEVLERLGVVQFRAGQTDAAEQTLRQVLQRDRRRPAALHLMGCLAFHREWTTGQDTGAQGYFEEALALRPDVAQTHYYAGRINRVHGQFQQAADHQEQAHRLDPHDPDVLVEMGQLLERAGKHDRAYKAYRRALQHAPQHADTHFYLGRWFERVGQDRQLSAQYYHRYLDLGGRDPELVRHIRRTV